MNDAKIIYETIKVNKKGEYIIEASQEIIDQFKKTLRSTSVIFDEKSELLNGVSFYINAMIKRELDSQKRDKYDITDNKQRIFIELVDQYEFIENEKTIEYFDNNFEKFINSSNAKKAIIENVTKLIMKKDEPNELLNNIYIIEENGELKIDFNADLDQIVNFMVEENQIDENEILSDKEVITKYLNCIEFEYSDLFFEKKNWKILEDSKNMVFDYDGFINALENEK